MELLQKLNDERKDFKRKSSEDIVSQFDITDFEKPNDIKNVKATIQGKCQEIINKHKNLTKYHRLLLRQLCSLKERYKEERGKIELPEIKSNNEKKRGEKLTKDQLEVLINSKLDKEMINAIENIENEIHICEITSKDHYLISEQLKTYNLTESSYQKYIRSNAL